MTAWQGGWRGCIPQSEAFWRVGGDENGVLKQTKSNVESRAISIALEVNNVLQPYGKQAAVMQIL